METLGFLLQTAVVTRALFLMPFEGRRKYQRLVDELKRNPAARPRFFAKFLVSWWLTAAIVIATLFLGADTPAQLRLVAPNAWVAPVLLGWLLYLALPVFRARKAGPYRDAVREQLDHVPALLPSTRLERWMFAAVSVTAGVCEELVFRGLVPLYFAKLLPGIPYVGAVLSIAGFGLGHAYQGARGVVLATMLGAIFYGSMALTGSIFPAMMLHAMNDLRFLALVWALARPLVDNSKRAP